MEDVSKDILLRCKRGETEAFRLVVRHYKSFVFSVIYRFLAGRYSAEVEDIAQEIFIRLYDFLKKYDTEREVKFSTCVFAIVRNYCFNELRIKRLQVEAPVENIEDEQGVDPLSETLVGELKQKVEKCVETLPDDQRMIFILREYEGLSYEEIGEQMNIPQGTVKSKLNRVKLKLKELLWPYIKSTTAD